MAHCPKCNSHGSGKFCSNCGTPYPEEEFLPWTGESLDTAVYRITLEPLEGEYSHEEQIYDELRHSCWGEGEHELKIEKIERVRSVITDEYTYICDTCKEFVSKKSKGKCNGCGDNNWVERKKEE